MAKPTQEGTLGVASLKPSPTQQRKTFPKSEMEELEASIRAHGVLQPILARPGKRKGIFEIVAGERRWRAAKSAGLDEVPVRWREMDDQEVVEIQLIENIQRKDVTPLEEAEGYKRLQDGGRTAQEIADQVGKSKSHVYGRIQMLRLTKEGCELALAGAIQAGHIVEIARLPTSAQEGVIKAFGWQMRNGHVSVRQLRDHIASEVRRKLEQAPWELDDAKLVGRAGTCTACPHNTANQDDSARQAKAECVMPSCWAKKLAAHRKRTIAAVKREHGDPPLLISTQDYLSFDHPDRDTALMKGSYERVPKKAEASTKGAKPALLIDGPSAGRVVMVKRAKKSGVRRQSAHDRRFAARQRKEKLERKRTRELGKRAFEALAELDVAPSKKALAQLLLLVDKWHGEEWLREHVGVTKPKTYSLAADRRMHEELLAKLQRKTVAELTRLMVVVVRADAFKGDHHGNTDRELLLCESMGVDVDGLRAEVKKEMPDPKPATKKKAAKKKAAKKKATKRKARSK